MANSDFTRTRDQIITAALRKLGAIATGGTPTANQISDGAEALNMLVKAWQNIGVRLWTVEWAYQTLASGTSKYYMDPILDIQKAFVRRGTNDYNVEVLDMVRYFDIPDKTDSGMVQVLAFDPIFNSPEITVWPIPDNSTDVLHFLQVRRLQDFDATGDKPDFPARWISALTWSLASELAPEYGLPLELRQDLTGRGAAYLEMAIRGEKAQGPSGDFIEGAY